MTTPATTTTPQPRTSVGLDRELLWYKDAVVYELHVRAFHDADGDGVGDFRGLTQKLDYLQDLGVTAIWLLPFCPSPLKDDGYDIADFTGIHPAYGTFQDFKTFLREAHRRGLRVITELVVNHTSDQHEWFQRSRRAKPGGRWRDFYVWSDTPERYPEARIIFKDFESSNWTWDPLAKAYYWHRFYAHQPDLNYDNPEVRKAITQILDFWLDLGVDGLRLDAVPYLYEREGTNCENLPETHAFLKELRRHVDRKYRTRMLLAEANQWPEDAIAYFGSGDECHMAFHFPLMPRLFMALRLENRFPITEILEQTPAVPEVCQWAVFLRNHDELTLEMVTDEERDYMYRVYASDPQMRINLGIRRRLAPLLGNNRRKIELMNGLLFSMPGTPVIYYGDELGMGDNIYLGDRNSVRTPMQWSGDRNAGFSRANPQKLYLPVTIDPEHHYEAVNVEAQQNNPSSMLWWMKRLTTLRKRHRAFGCGTVEFLRPDNHKILAFIRRHEGETILIVANLSRFTQAAELDLSACQGLVPVELFGQTPFPAIGELPYFVTLGPHTFYWFSLESPPAAGQASRPRDIPMLEVDGEWTEALRGDRAAVADLEQALPSHLATSRWFGGKARTISAVRLTERLSLSPSTDLAFAQVEYTDAEPERYLLPLAFAADPAAAASPGPGVVARLRLGGAQEATEGVIRDASHDHELATLLLEAFRRQRQVKGAAGQLTTDAAQAAKRLRAMSDDDLKPRLLSGEQSNTSIVYGDQVILKLFRRLEPGLNPDVEIGRFLTERCGFPHTPPFLGVIEYRQRSREPITLAMLQGFVPNQGDAWRYTLDALDEYYERVLTQPAEALAALQTDRPPLALVEEEIPPPAQELIGAYLPLARLLGLRTAELHAALASDRSDPGFAPEPFTALYQRSLYQSMRNQVGQVLPLLRKRLPALPEGIRADAKAILGQEAQMLKAFQSLQARRLSAMRIRCHGDYHLGQVLYTGKDFVIFDFEGEPGHAISERRLKRSPVRDIAGMLRSFQYAAFAPLLSRPATGGAGSSSRPEDRRAMEPWAPVWATWVSAVFLKAYLAGAAQADCLPKSQEELRILVDAFLLNKAVYELGYELNHRPDWVRIPLRGIRDLLVQGAS